MQASRRSVKAHYSSGPIGSSLSTGFQVYLSKCWDPYISSGCTIRLAFFLVCLPCFCMMILSLPLLGLRSKSTSHSPRFCVRGPRQYNMIGWKFGLFSEFFVFPRLIVLGKWNQGMWQVSCRKLSMATKGPTADPKCKLIIPSFLALPHLLECLICTRNAMSIVLFLQMMGAWDRWRVVDLY